MWWVISPSRAWKKPTGKNSSREGAASARVAGNKEARNNKREGNSNKGVRSKEAAAVATSARVAVAASSKSHVPTTGRSPDRIPTSSGDPIQAIITTITPTEINRSLSASRHPETFAYDFGPRRSNSSLQG